LIGRALIESPAMVVGQTVLSQHAVRTATPEFGVVQFGALVNRVRIVIGDTLAAEIQQRQL
jgi:hypothetical protein